MAVDPAKASGSPAEKEGKAWLLVLLDAAGRTEFVRPRIEPASNPLHQSANYLRGVAVTSLVTQDTAKPGCKTI